MLLQNTLLTALAVVPVLSETVHSVLVFTRHGDRTAKFFKGYQMTNLGATQVYSSGNFYRQRYVETGAPLRIAGIAPDDVRPTQIWASAPDQYVLYQTATNFLQGLYPPLADLNATLATEELTNGTETESPLNGYQFILVHGEAESDPDTIWIKGDDSCPAYDDASLSYRQSTQYQATLASSASFYSRFVPLLGSIMGNENVTYRNAYDVFDLLNVASIHNASVASQINASDLDQLRYYANEWEWNHNYNATLPDRSIGGMALAGGILRQLRSVVSTSARTKFSLMAGSYDTFLSFFGLTNLTAASLDFQGIPNYAANMAFELYTNDTNGPFPTNPSTDLMIRFLFRNGTEDSDSLEAYPLFGGSQISMTYGDFVDELSNRSINSIDQWCSTCLSEAHFCAVVNEQASASNSSSSSTSGNTSGLSNAAAGGIGAGVTLAIVAFIATITWLMMRKKSPAAAGSVPEKRLSGSESDSV